MNIDFNKPHYLCSWDETAQVHTRETLFDEYKDTNLYDDPNDDDFMDGIQDTISLHRKKNTNTLYTINALNETIRSLNGGKLDKSYMVPWENYQNKLLLTNESGLNVIPTRIYTIIDVNTWETKIDNE